jgi:opacity protein-like surface antigen
MSKGISLVTGASLAFAMGLRISDAWAQYYIGAQVGWTGLPYQTDTIDGLGSVPVEFSAGYNVGVRGGYQSGPWRFEEEYSHRRNDAAEFGAGDSTNGVSGNRHTHSIMTNVLYDLTTGWPITPHIGVGIGAMNVFDGLRVPGIGRVFNDSNWQFGYQAIAGLRYDINPLFRPRSRLPLSGDDRIHIQDSQYGAALPLECQHKQLCSQCDLPVRPTAVDQPPLCP